MVKLRILVVDDDKNMQNLYKVVLTEDMFEPCFSDNGVEALGLYHSWKPDIILLDIMLPGMTGYSVLQEIRVKLRDAATTIIMVSSLSDKSDVEDCGRLGIQGYIVKPIKHAEIGNKIVQFYQRARQASAGVA